MMNTLKDINTSISNIKSSISKLYPIEYSVV